MEDPLKKHIDSRRTDFDPFEADFEGIWGEVSKALDAKEGSTPKRTSLWPKLWKAAAMLSLAMGIGWLIIPRSQPMVANTAKSQWLETQEFYSAAIEEKMQVLDRKKETLDSRIFEDLEALDQAMKELKTDLNDQADNEEVVNAMVRNYQIKLKILEEILEQLQQNESDDNQGMEDTAA